MFLGCLYTHTTEEASWSRSPTSSFSKGTINTNTTCYFRNFRKITNLT
jgi:hypothetical protein